MDELLAAFDRLFATFEGQAEINEKFQACIHGLNKLDDQRASEIDELREGIAALSHRIEGIVAAYGSPESVRVLRQP